MNPALAFVSAFARGDLDAVEGLLAEAFRFQGPLLVTGTRAEYLRALRADPPRPCEARIVHHVTEADEDAVVYDLVDREGASLRVAQWSRTREGRLVELELVFDPSRLGRDQSKSEQDMK